MTPSPIMERRRASKRQARRRVANACQRCRRHKIKCSGECPCRNCENRGALCAFAADEKRILVPENYLLQLKERIAQLEGRVSDDREQPNPNLLLESEGERRCSTNGGINPIQRSLTTPDNSPHVEPLIEALDEEHASYVPPSSSLTNSTGMTSMSNPLASEIPAYMQDMAGRLRHLGHTSTWSFNHRVLSLVDAKISQTPLDQTSFHAEAEAFDLGWNGLRDASAADISGLPSLDFALYLVNTVKFWICQSFHLFDEESFFSNFYSFYESPAVVSSTCRLWYTHYLLIIALGKALIGHNRNSNQVPGCDLFVRAMKILPDVTYLCSEQIMSAEVLICTSLYLQALDFRGAAHVRVGQAMRVVMSHGLHTDMQPQDLGEEFVHRCRKIWWTIYILDRRFSSSIGVPNSILDEDISTPLPVFPENNIHTTVFTIHVKLSQVLGTIVSTIYGRDGRLDRTFLTTTQRVLRLVAGLAEELAQFSSRLTGGVSRTVGFLNLTYHQTIILATRPVLYYVLRLRLDSQTTTPPEMELSEPAKGLLHICLDSARQIVHILSTLQEQSLLDSFLPFDLEGVSSSGFVLAIAKALYPGALPDDQSLQAIVDLLQEMSTNGNALAKIRLDEIEQLVKVMSRLYSDGDMQSCRRHSLDDGAFPDEAMPRDAIPSPELALFEDLGFDEGLSTTQMLSLADALNPEEFPELWVST